MFNAAEEPGLDHRSSRLESFCREPAAASNAASHGCSSLVRRLRCRGRTRRMNNSPRPVSDFTLRNFSSTDVSEPPRLPPGSSLLLLLWLLPLEKPQPSITPALPPPDCQRSAARARAAREERVASRPGLASPAFLPTPGQQGIKPQGLLQPYGGTVPSSISLFGVSEVSHCPPALHTKTPEHSD